MCKAGHYNHSVDNWPVDKLHTKSVTGIYAMLSIAVLGYGFISSSL